MPMSAIAQPTIRCIGTLPFVIAMPHRVQPASGIPIVLAALAFLAYSIAIKRYWAIGLGLLIAFIAVMGWIVAAR